MNESVNRQMNEGIKMLTNLPVTQVVMKIHFMEPAVLCEYN